MLGIFHAMLSSADFFKINFLKIFFQEQYQGVFCFVALPAMFMAGPSFHLTTLFPGQA